jgi:hypothetical protein
MRAAYHRIMRAWIVVLGAMLVMTHGNARAFDVVLNAQGEYLDAYLIDGTEPPPRVVFIDPDPPEPDEPKGKPARVGRHVNGKLCFFPKGFGPKGGFVIADDTYREACLDRATPQARCSVTRKRSRHYVGQDPDGWGVFKRNGKWAKRVIHVDVEGEFSDDNQPQGTIDPQGCAFDENGNLWATDVGHADPGSPDGAFLVFFPGKKRRYDSYCFLDRRLAAPGMPIRDDAGNFYLAEPAGFRVTKFAPPFPSSAADCDNPERLVTTPPTKTVFLDTASGLSTPAGLARVPGSDHVYVGSVLIPKIINEYDGAGAFVRTIVPTDVPRNPLGIDVGADGTVYYAELNLDPVTTRTRCGSVSRVRFDGSGMPLAPEELGRRLRFPDGVTVVDSSQLRVKWGKLPAAPDIDPARCGGE